MISNRFKHSSLHTYKSNYSRLISKLNNKSFFYNIAKCPVCSSDHNVKISNVDRYGCNYTLVCCNQCSLIFSNSRIKKDKLIEYYSHFANMIKINGKNLLKVFESRISLRSYAWDRFYWISRFIKNNHVNNVFEFGCSDGANLFPFYKNNSNVSGVDFNELRINIGKSRGLNISSINFENETVIFLKKNNPELVIISHVIEHLSDIYSTIKMLIENTKLGTYFFFETPGIDYVVNESKFDLYPKDNNLMGYLQFEHLYFFSEQYLNSFLKIFGLRKINSNSIYRGIFQKVSNDIPDRLMISKEMSKLNQDWFSILSKNEKKYKSEVSFIKYYFKKFI